MIRNTLAVLYVLFCALSGYLLYFSHLDENLKTTLMIFLLSAFATSSYLFLFKEVD